MFYTEQLNCHGLDINQTGLDRLLSCELVGDDVLSGPLDQVEASLLHSRVSDDGSCSGCEDPADIRGCPEAQQTEQNPPELFIFPAVDDNVDGGVEDEEEVGEEGQKLTPATGR